MGYAGMGVHIFPLLVKLLIEGGVDSSCVHVVSGRDDEIASVPEAKVPDGRCDLLLVVVARTPVPDCDEVNFIVTSELDLSMLKIKSEYDLPTWLSVHLPTSLALSREEEETRKGEMVKSRKIIVVILLEALMQRNMKPKYILKFLSLVHFCGARKQFCRNSWIIPFRVNDANAYLSVCLP